MSQIALLEKHSVDFWCNRVVWGMLLFIDFEKSVWFLRVELPVQSTRGYEFCPMFRKCESEEWSSQLIFQFKQLERRSLKKKNQGFNGIRTCDLRDTGAMLYQLSYEATHWERGQLIEFTSSLEEWNDMKFISNNSYMNCGFESRWSPDFFQASSFQLLKLEN